MQAREITMVFSRLSNIEGILVFFPDRRACPEARNCGRHRDEPRKRTASGACPASPANAMPFSVRVYFMSCSVWGKKKFFGAFFEFAKSINGSAPFSSALKRDIILDFNGRINQHGFRHLFDDTGQLILLD